MKQQKMKKFWKITAIALSALCLISPITTLRAFGEEGEGDTGGESGDGRNSRIAPPSWITPTPDPGSGGEGGIEIPEGMNLMTVCVGEELRDEFGHLGVTLVGEVGDAIYASVDFVNRAVSEIPRWNQQESFNDIDTLIYIIRILEDVAQEVSDYYVEVNGEEYGFSRTDINNWVLFYIRSMVNKYVGDSLIDSIPWEVIAGEHHNIQICNHLSSGFPRDFYINEYFASFMEGEDDYNVSYGHTYLSPDFQFRKLKLQDPLGSGQEIDLLHMLASLDGIYNDTGKSGLCDTFFGDNNHQRDLISWLGDLQTFVAKDIPRYSGELREYNSTYGHIDFNEFAKNDPNSTTKGSFSAADLLADIDAMNIAKLFLDDGRNKLSNAIAAYYNTIKQDDQSVGNRYYEFVYSVTRDLDFSRTDSLQENFRNEVFRSLNINYNGDTYSNHNYFSVVTPSTWLLQNWAESQITFASLENRYYGAKLFYDYIVSMSHRFD